MSVWKEIRCDRNSSGDCHDNRNENPTGFGPMAALRKKAGKWGWRRVDGDDVCPACAKEPQP